MSGDDWSDREIDDGGRGNRAVDREIERLKSRYRRHAEELSRLAASAPTKALARKYSDLIGDINRSILSLDDPGALASLSSSEQPILSDPNPTEPMPPSGRSPSEVPLRTEPGRVAIEPEPNALGRIVLILFMALILMSLLAFFVWKYGGEPRAEPAPTMPAATAEASPEPVPTPDLTISPEAQDFGIVYKGTRVAKPFEVTNHSDRDLTIEVERSECRCLWFDYARQIPAGGTITLTVAVDGGLATPGLVSEAVVITSTEQPRVATGGVAGVPVPRFFRFACTIATPEKMTSIPMIAFAVIFSSRISQPR